MKRLIGVLAALCCLAVTPAQAQAQQAALAPDALAKSVTDDVLAALRADKEIQSGNLGKVVELIEKKVIPHFDFTRMTQLAMARYWQQATPDQQKALVAEFRALLVQTYATMFVSYRDQKIDFRPLRMEPNETEVVVKSLINQPGGRPIAADYKMRRTDAGWKVYDVVVGDLSLVQTYRGTFSGEVQRSGIDGLIKALADKNKQLSTDTRAARK